jgi:hypothetical protein
MEESMKPNDKLAAMNTSQAPDIKSAHVSILDEHRKGGAKPFTSKWSKIIISITMDAE